MRLQQSSCAARWRIQSQKVDNGKIPDMRRPAQRPSRGGKIGEHKAAQGKEIHVSKKDRCMFALITGKPKPRQLHGVPDAMAVAVAQNLGSRGPWALLCAPYKGSPDALDHDEAHPQ